MFHFYWIDGVRRRNRGQNGDLIQQVSNMIEFRVPDACPSFSS